jgi:hypothetical protein
MATKKLSSRNADRNQVKRMHAQGYSVQQIADKLSIVPVHIEYLLNGYEGDLKKLNTVKADSELEGLEEQVRLAKAKMAGDPNTPDMEALKAQMKAEILEELGREQTPPDKIEEPVKRRRKAKAA